MSRMFGSTAAQNPEEAMLSRLLQAKQDEVKQIFGAMDLSGDGTVSRTQLEAVLAAQGLDPSLSYITSELDEICGPDGMSFATFSKLMHSERSTVFKRTLMGELAIPNFPDFCEDVVKIFEDSRSCQSGKNATYIPQLANVDPLLYAFSLCTVDGQEFSYGDVDVPFCLQSCVKPFMYTMACREHGVDEVHKYIGREPSGVAFNAFTLNSEKKPHNPMINAGAITSCSLIMNDVPDSIRFAQVLEYLSDFAGGSRIGFNQPVYLSERDTADRNFALGYFMQHEGVFKEGTRLVNALEFYFQACSTEADCLTLARMASTLANGGVSPTTHKKVCDIETVKSTIQLMLSCGMYDYSGEWACTIGLPAKSGVAGAIMVVIPNVMGITVWSPPLDERGNSARGVDFCTRLANHFSFSIFDQLLKSSSKVDPTIPNPERSIRYQPVTAEGLRMVSGRDQASSSSSNSSTDTGKHDRLSDDDENDPRAQRKRVRA
mmetsp:Transcript_7770/g.23911  ORF Transcript_7770/g.23911 Transcript_7770/m.23911 type:complete len:489 (+) Transcript_7770:2170-3636(+)|eukprot:CAMPEP_0177682240 /NCGR_PEP_ID=MMETSP0447-20121125/31154_1 /TAXON_ID=0 /ORGANISM="Stygamoeba regulata, Strain BSH-02190019" /LENGTH=488 /DNA_ID=CAMNT_0019191731 /DNA_START=219 /DNA_END=1685 /DNA_ORIENTATION=-